MVKGGGRMWAPRPGGGEDDPESRTGTGGEAAALDHATEAQADVAVQEEEDPWQSGGGTGADPWAGYGPAGGGSNLDTDSQDRATWSDEWWDNWGWYSSRDGARGYEAEYQGKHYSDDQTWKTGWWTDAQTRRFSHCELNSLVASQSGVWHGAATPPGGHHAAEEMPWDFGNRKDKPSERLNVPTFDGEAEDEKLGLGARSYLRKMQVWLRCTRLPPEQRALALYSALSGRAWSFSEELNLDRLATAEGVEYFQEWIRTRFLDLELTKVGRVMTEFFRKFKRRPEHSMRDYNMEYERMILRLQEVSCELPPLVKAWAYLDKMGISESDETALLSSVGNQFDYGLLQRAALLQDRTLRRPQELFGGKPRTNNGWFGKRRERGQTAWMADDIDEGDTNQDGADGEDGAESGEDIMPEEVASELHTTFEAHLAAKARFKATVSGRGVDQDEAKARAKQRLQEAKNRSYCSACKRKGHWHKDAACPLNKGVSKEGGRPGHEVHVVFTTAADNDHIGVIDEDMIQLDPALVFEAGMDNDTRRAGNSGPAGGPHQNLVAIMDTACSRSVAGYDWFLEYTRFAEANRLPIYTVDQSETFRFGASRPHQSSFAVWAVLGLESKNFLVKVSIVNCTGGRVPLLLSRTALARLGTVLDVRGHRADFLSLGIDGIELGLTATGHPTIPVDQLGDHIPIKAFFDSLPDHQEVALLLSPPQVYMAHSSGGPTTPIDEGEKDFPKLFYPKKVPLVVQNFLSGLDALPKETFLSWWKHNKIGRDFWVETSERMIRVHVTPRRTWFDPRDWKTDQSALKKKLIESLGPLCQVDLIPCVPAGPSQTVTHDWQSGASTRESPQNLWIGRSSFTRAQRMPSPSELINSEPNVLYADLAMEDAKRRSDEDAGGHGHTIPPLLDSAGATSAGGGEQASQGDSDLSEADGQDELDRAEGGSGEGGHRGTGEGHPGLAPAATPQKKGGARIDGGSLWTLPRVDVPRDPGGVPGVGHGRGGEKRKRVRGPEKTGNLGAKPKLGGRPGEERREALQMDRQDGQGPGDPGGGTASPEDGSPILGFLRRGWNILLSSDTQPWRREGLHQDQSDPEESGRQGMDGDHGLGCRPGEDHSTGDGAGGAAGQEQPGPGDQEGVGAKGTGDAKAAQDAKGAGDAKAAQDAKGAGVPEEADDAEEPCGQISADEKFRRAVAGVRRRKMKATTRKKLQNMARATKNVISMCFMTAVALTQEVVGEPANDLWTCCSGARVAPEADEERPDLLEIFAGKGRISRTFEAAGLAVLPPWDLLHGQDLRQATRRAEVLRLIEEKRPRLVWLAPPCTNFCGFSHLNHSPQELRRLRQRDRVFLELYDEVMLLQKMSGGHTILENPSRSALWQEPLVRKWVEDPGSYTFNLDLCRFGMMSLDGKERLRKTVRLTTTSGAFEKILGKQCDGGHEHRRIQGAETGATAHYPWRFARGVLKAYLKTMANLGEHTAFAVDKTGGGIPKDGPDLDETELVPDEEWQGSRGITFSEQIPAKWAAICKKLHQNLGHPPNDELARQLKYSDADEHLIRAAKCLKCQTCSRCTKPGTRRPARPATLMDFGEALAMDVIHFDDSTGNKVKALSMVDMGSTYHVVCPLPSTTSTDITQAYHMYWASWAGHPRFILIDLDSGFKDQFLSMVGDTGVHIRSIAAQAHWQGGLVERHNASWKAIWEKTCKHEVILPSEVPLGITAVNDAKNCLRNRDGYAPRQWVFGSMPREVGDIMEEPDSFETLKVTKDAKMSRINAIRMGAKASFFKIQSKDSTRRALLRRPRVQKHEFALGDLAYYYREYRAPKSTKAVGRWLGPCSVIGFEGNNVWLSQGGRCLLCAREHLRPADHEEVNALFRLKTSLAEVDAVMRNQDLQEFIEAQGVDVETGEQIQLEAEEVNPTNEDTVMDERVRKAGEIADQLRGFTRRRRSLDDVPQRMQKIRRSSSAKGSGRASSASKSAVREVMMVKRGSSEKSKDKALEKELPWERIPEEEKHLYVEAEVKQWQEHLKFEAVRPLSIAESKWVRENVANDRILNCRFAYRDKNYSKRKAAPDAGIPCKPKARLCVGGHMDPDIGKVEMQCDAPTATRTSLMLTLQKSLNEDWEVCTADVQAAFLNGIPAGRNLYFRQPKRGIPGLEPHQLVSIEKGVFGLSTSPRLWWEKLSKDVTNLKLEVEGETLVVKHNLIDPCVFEFRTLEGEVRALMLSHVDDLLLAGRKAINAAIRQKLDAMFPIDEWNFGDFDYVGSHYDLDMEKSTITITQKDYIDGRLQRLDFDKEADEEKEVDGELKADNRTVVGSLSWLALQSRPDLQMGVAEAQRHQNAPRIKHLKETNALVTQAGKFQSEGITLRKIQPGREILIAYHDAAWGNVELEGERDEEWEGKFLTGSQLGVMIFMADKDVLNKEGGLASPLTWMSKVCKRTCRSTFAGETMACCEASEHALFLRDLWSSFQKSKSGVMDFHLMTDCRSLYDHIHRAGAPKAPSEKRLAIDLAGLRQILRQEGQRQWELRNPGLEPTPTRPMKVPLHWVPTEWQMSDVLTKRMCPRKWWALMASGNIQIPWKFNKQK